MTVANLRRQLLNFTDREPDSADGSFHAVADALGRFEDMSLGAFAGLLGKVRIPIPKGPRKSRKTPEQVAAEKAENDRLAQVKAAQKRAEADRKAVEKAKLAREKAEQKRLEKDRKDREKLEPSPEIKRLGAALNDLVERAKFERATYAEIEEHIARLEPLTKPQLLQVAKLVNSDSGLAARPKKDIVKRLGDKFRRVLGTAERVKM